MLRVALRHIFSLTFLPALLIAGLATLSCSRIDDNRLPPVNVNIVFTTDGMWQVYGVGGALEWKRFIKSSTEAVPSNFPYTISSYTGFGGILLVGDLYGNPIAYDLACPYEARADIRITVDPEANNASCPVCHSVYDIFGGNGRPIGGPAADRGYGLTRYKVYSGGDMNYKVITR